MAGTNPHPTQPASPGILVVDDDVEPGHPGHDSAFSLTPVAGPDSSAELEVDHDTGVFAAEEAEDMPGISNDNDSTYGGSLIGCDTDTLASYITDFRYENGRRYHAYRDGEYWVLPSLHLQILHC